MGSREFMITAEGKDAGEAFREAVEEAKYESGHDGYTGTIAEKTSYVMVDDTWKEVKQRYIDTLSSLADLLKTIGATSPDSFNLESIEEELMSLPIGVYLYKKNAKTKTGAMADIRSSMKTLRDKRDECRSGMTPEFIAEHLLYDTNNSNFNDKESPAGCIDLKPRLTGVRKPKQFLFFGWSNS